MNEHHADCEPLLELATPHLYRRNLFRVLGLSVNATARDVQRQQTRRQMQAHLGVAAPEDRGGPLALYPPPTEEDIRAAMERLHRPLDRLLDEVFWFWPTNGNGAPDPALQALEEGQVERAAALWMAQMSAASQGPIATHNLAVLDHLVALDDEARMAAEKADKAQDIRAVKLWRQPWRLFSTRKPSQEQETRQADLWHRAFVRWKAVCDGEAFWSVVRDRVRDLNDVQLTTGVVRRIRGTLPMALLLINAKMAYSAAERSDTPLAQRHLRLLQKADFSDGLADEAILEALKPLRNRITTTIETAKSRWASTPQHGDQTVRALHGQAKDLLAVVDVLLPTDHLVGAGLHDMVAETMFEGQVAFGKKTNDWHASITLLQLAQKVAVSASVQSRLAEDITILRKNVPAGNDWYTPGYWALPAATVAHLEAAEELVRAGNYDGAIHALLGLVPTIGKPLRRCLAHSLSRQGIRIHNEAFSEYNNTDTERLATLLRKLRGMSEGARRLVLGRRPDPALPSSMNPPCLGCGEGYTRWVNFTYKDLPLFWCAACEERDNTQRAQQKNTLRCDIETALAYLLFADEVDPGDTGVRRNLQVVREEAQKIGCSIPNTKALQEKLTAEKTRGTRRTFALGPEDRVCFFCGASRAEDSCNITMPMCGDLQPVTMLFHPGITYQYADVVVPRCRRCRDEHRALPDRLEQWQEARLATADDTHFPAFLKELKLTEHAARDSLSRVNEHTQKVAAARTALQKAESVGEQCERCHSPAYWDGSLCRRCDKQVFHLGALSKGAVAGTVLLALTAIAILHTNLDMLSQLAAFVASHSAWSVHETERYVPLIAGGTLPLCFGLALAGGLKQRQWRRRRTLRNQQAEEIPQRRAAAVAAAQAQLHQENAALEAAKQAAQKPVQAHETAQNKLRLTREKAIAAFERASPEPKLPTGMQPEDTYRDFSRIRTLCESGWGFGHQPVNEGKQVGQSPVNVQGLVARVPRPVPTGGRVRAAGR